MTTVIQPTKLAGLKQAVYVMEGLVKGQSEEQMAMTLDCEEQLITMWVVFLTHNHWIERTMSGWSVSAKGAEWSRKQD